MLFKGPGVFHGVIQSYLPGSINWVYEKWEETVKVPSTKLSSSCSVPPIPPYFMTLFCLPSFHPSSFTSFSTFFLSSLNLRKLPGLWGSTLCRYSMHAVGGCDGACTIGHLILTWAPALRTALLSLLRHTNARFCGDVWDRVAVEIAVRGFLFLGYG